LVDEVVIEDGVAKGVKLQNGDTFHAKAVIVTTGTYMQSLILMGHSKTPGAPNQQKTTSGLSHQFKALGFNLYRLKTGTPPRLKTNSIDFSKTEKHPGDAVHRYFSFDEPQPYDLHAQYDCYLTYTTAKTHEIIEENLDKSAMYSGVIEGVGPRYCPSIEDKWVRFNDKPRHQIFLEPESAELDEIYVQGFSTSMPKEVQELMVKSIPGCENAVISKYAYAIEYDAVDARQLWPTLETKLVQGLYLAGQVNGTSGYEEAACQGLMAAINAARKIQKKEPIILKRHEAYIGVLIDDLVTKGTVEPYRLLTSRAEHRLLLRHDNADMRLMDKGYEIGLVDHDNYRRFVERRQSIASIKQQMKELILYPKPSVIEILKNLGSSSIKDKISFYELLKRPEIKAHHAIHFGYLGIEDSALLEQIEIDVKYEGYIDKANKLALKLESQENVKIPLDIHYERIHNLASEAKDKLTQVRPLTLGQAARISGVNPNDIAVLSVYLKMHASA
jgi:tRNA uridine 5-carboxymethylaminomethyl modification enzyme